MDSELQRLFDRYYDLIRLGQPGRPHPDTGRTANELAQHTDVRLYGPASVYCYKDQLPPRDILEKALAEAESNRGNGAFNIWALRGQIRELTEALESLG